MRMLSASKAAAPFFPAPRFRIIGWMIFTALVTGGAECIPDVADCTSDADCTPDYHCEVHREVCVPGAPQAPDAGFSAATSSSTSIASAGSSSAPASSQDSSGTNSSSATSSSGGHDAAARVRFITGAGGVTQRPSGESIRFFVGQPVGVAQRAGGTNLQPGIYPQSAINP